MVWGWLGRRARHTSLLVRMATPGRRLIIGSSSYTPPWRTNARKGTPFSRRLMVRLEIQLKQNFGLYIATAAALARMFPVDALDNIDGPLSRKFMSMLSGVYNAPVKPSTLPIDNGPSGTGSASPSTACRARSGGMSGVIVGIWME